MVYTMDDFKRQYIMEHFAQLTPQERREALQRLSVESRRELLQLLSPEDRLAGLSLEERLAGLSPEQIRRLLEQLAAGGTAQPRKPRRKR